MPDSAVATFTEPYAYHAAIRTQPAEGVVTTRGDFHAELTRIDLDRLLMQLLVEKLPHVLSFPTNPQRATILFAADRSHPEMHVSGLRLSADDIIASRSGLAA